jgi:hypothetical protein
MTVALTRTPVRPLPREARRTRALRAAEAGYARKKATVIDRRYI